MDMWVLGKTLLHPIEVYWKFHMQRYNFYHIYEMAKVISTTRNSQKVG